MIWIKSDIDLGDHPKTYQLCSYLMIDRPEAVGLLTLLWHFTMKYAWRDGSLERFSPNAVCGAIGWRKDADTLMRGLKECGWLDAEMRVHDWLEYSGKLVNDRLSQERRRREVARRRRPASERSLVGDKRSLVAPRADKIRADNKKNKTLFVKPTPEELKAYCRERQNRVDPEKWLAYYESNGWRVGRNPIRDWKAAVRTWERNDFNPAINPAFQPAVPFDAARLAAKKDELEKLKEREWAKRLKTGNASGNPPWPAPFAAPLVDAGAKTGPTDP